ncbi:effector binding domain-containing protein [Marinimicrobium sp. C6131]|uniref:GyrI-like domain-containing protein n=1 Tax=Marinimicrobium sp. C6131 TaxID=3022676 RepID=UPI00223E0903|nr:effector binding domain-containing protein [Marinimicrobium sp. C6131]UZJ44355.1 effector binding domain-containing protein [Marinimicrobium sp. C6131]
MMPVTTPHRRHTKRSPHHRFPSDPLSEAPRLIEIRNQPEIKLAGLRSPVKGLPFSNLMALRKTFLPYQGWLPEQVDRRLYGALLHSKNGADGFDYLTAVEVESFEHLNSDWQQLTIPAQHYAVFAHEKHLSALRTTTHAIFSNSLPSLNLLPLRHVPDVPQFLERYEESFDLNSGWGDLQIWVPIQQKVDSVPIVASIPFRDGTQDR